MVVAFLSNEIAFLGLPAAGGLGFLAGDYVRAAQDEGLDLIGVTIFPHEGYFDQRILDGRQVEEYPVQDLKGIATPLEVRVSVPGVGGRNIQIQPWEYPVGDHARLLLLSTDLEGNHPEDRKITSRLYQDELKLRQQLVLVVGGVRVLRELGITPDVFHLNEGHTAFAVPELGNARDYTVFTTHTPIPEGHDRFSYDDVTRCSGAYLDGNLRSWLGGSEVNMTRMGIMGSGQVLAVSKKHAEVMRRMFPDISFGYVTNGVHSGTWTAPEFQQVYNKFIPRWKKDPTLLSGAGCIPDTEIAKAHASAKRRLVDRVNAEFKAGFDTDTFTVGFARRATDYKRMGLLFQDPTRLRGLARDGLQVVMAGKAHPNDAKGKELIAYVHRMAQELKGAVKIVYLPNYSMEEGMLLTAGSDVWLNTPRPPLEASGTSGMKAAHNGVPQLSTVDGWWCEVPVIEGRRMGGWDIGSEEDAFLSIEQMDAKHAQDLYAVLAQALQLFKTPAWAEKMKEAIQKNAAFFNSARQLRQHLPIYRLR